MEKENANDKSCGGQISWQVYVKESWLSLHPIEVPLGYRQNKVKFEKLVTEELLFS